jgi:hypothetical protein
MKEQSHKDEMSAALRGDFQRLRERGVSPALVPHEAPEPEDEPLRPVPQPSAAEEELHDPAADTAPARRGWLARLAGR